MQEKKINLNKDFEIYKKINKNNLRILEISRNIDSYDSSCYDKESYEELEKEGEEGNALSKENQAFISELEKLFKVVEIKRSQSITKPEISFEIENYLFFWVKELGNVHNLISENIPIFDIGPEFPSTYNPYFFYGFLKSMNLNITRKVSFSTKIVSYSRLNWTEFVDGIFKLLICLYTSDIEEIDIQELYHRVDYNCRLYFSCDFYEFVTFPLEKLSGWVSNTKTAKLFMSLIEKDISIKEKDDKIDVDSLTIKKIYLLNSMRIRDEIKEIDFVSIKDFPSFETFEFREETSFLRWALEHTDCYLSLFLISNFSNRNKDLNTLLDIEFQKIGFSEFEGFKTDNIDNLCIRLKSLLRPILVFRCFLLFLFDLSLSGISSSSFMTYLNIFILFFFILGIADPVWFRMKMHYRNKEVMSDNNCYRKAYDKCAYFKCGSIYIENTAMSLDLHAEWDLKYTPGLIPKENISLPHQSHGYKFIGNLLSKQYIVNGAFITDEYNDNISLKEPHIYLLPINYTSEQKEAFIDCVYLLFKRKIFFEGTMLIFDCRGNIRNTIGKAIINYCRINGWNYPFMLKESPKSHKEACNNFKAAMDAYLTEKTNSCSLPKKQDVVVEEVNYPVKRPLLKKIDLNSYEQWHIVLDINREEEDRLKKERLKAEEERKKMFSEDGYLSPGEYLEYKNKKRRNFDNNFKNYEAEFWSKLTPGSRDVESLRRRFQQSKNNYDKYRKQKFFSESYEPQKIEKLVLLRHPDTFKKGFKYGDKFYEDMKNDKDLKKKVENLEIPGVFSERDTDRGLKIAEEWVTVKNLKKTRIVEGNRIDVWLNSLEVLRKKSFKRNIRNRYSPLLNLFKKQDKERSDPDSVGNKKIAKRDDFFKTILKEDYSGLDERDISEKIKKKIKKTKRVFQDKYTLAKKLEAAISKKKKKEKSKLAHPPTTINSTENVIISDELRSEIQVCRAIRNEMRKMGASRIADRLSIDELSLIGNVRSPYFSRKEVNARKGLRKFLKNLCNF